MDASGDDAVALFDIVASHGVAAAGEDELVDGLWEDELVDGLRDRHQVRVLDVLFLTLKPVTASLWTAINPSPASELVQGDLPAHVQQVGSVKCNLSLPQVAGADAVACLLHRNRGEAPREEHFDSQGSRSADVVEIGKIRSHKMPGHHCRTPNPWVATVAISDAAKADMGMLHLRAQVMLEAP
jgi:hypothetical protein